MSAATPIQHAAHYAPLELRSAIVPAANFGSTLSWPLFLIGLIAGIRPLITAGIVLFSLAVLFQLVTLPVEINASARALRMLQSTGILGTEETGGARKVLTAAAFDLCGGSGGVHTAASETFDTCGRKEK